MTSKMCDFCGTPGIPGTPRWMYVLSPNRPVVGLGNDAGSAVYFDNDGVWLACADCSVLVDAENITGLIERVSRSMGTGIPLHEPHFRDMWTALMAAQYEAVMQSTTVKFPAA